MKILIAVVSAVLLLGFAHEVVAEKPENGPSALEKKLHGAWKGESSCLGDLTLRADGTYEKTRCGPGNNTFAGTWKVRWDALPPTLVMTCKTSDDPKAVGTKTEEELTKLDDKALVVASSGYTWRYSRMKK